MISSCGLWVILTMARRRLASGNVFLSLEKASVIIWSVCDGNVIHASRSDAPYLLTLHFLITFLIDITRERTTSRRLKWIAHTKFFRFRGELLLRRRGKKSEQNQWKELKKEKEMIIKDGGRSSAIGVPRSSSSELRFFSGTLVWIRPSGKTVPSLVCSTPKSTFTASLSFYSPHFSRFYSFRFLNNDQNKRNRRKEQSSLIGFYSPFFLYFILTIGNHVACVKPPKGVNLILLNSRTVAQLSLHHSYCNLRARIIFVATSECCGVSFDCGWHSRSIYFCAFFTPFFLVRGGPLTQTQNKNKSHSVFSRKSEIQQEIMMMMSSGPKSTRRGRPNCYT